MGTNSRKALSAGLLLGVLSALLVAPAGFAAGDAESSTPSASAAPDPFLERYRATSGAKDWTRAAAAMREAVVAGPRNADYHNLYAYSLRQQANPDMSLVFKHYNEALRIDPKHRGAHEYLGEAYLMTGNLAKAKEHLGELDRLCFFGCGEFSDLKKKIASYEAGPKR